MIEAEYQCFDCKGKATVRIEVDPRQPFFAEPPPLRCARCKDLPLMRRLRLEKANSASKLIVAPTFQPPADVTRLR